MRVTDDIKYVGVNDHQIDLFEGQYVVPLGMAYNSYVILDEKIAVMDTVDQHFGQEWLDNLAAVLDGRKPDYLIVQHMEPDHSANITSFLEVYPDAVVVGNAKTFTFMEQFYGKNPERYVKGLYRVGIHEDLKLPLVGYQPPHIRMPQKNQRGQYVNWSKTALPWMSIGYETQIAPINTVTFYNAIANNGKMMRPRFVKKVVKNGETIAEFPPEVIKNRIAKPKAIKTIQTILEHVVSQGLGRKAGSKLFKVAGKTGTAQIADEHGGYHSGTTRYWLSFAGYFPADNPHYTCIVCLKKSGLPASGGGMSGVVFHHIAEGVMARNLKMSVDAAHDEKSVIIPDVKNGNTTAANYVLSKLDINKRVGQSPKYKQSVCPDVTGMGAKDAVYELEHRGLRVKIHGRGKVRHQSYPAGKQIMKGCECLLILE